MSASQKAAANNNELRRYSKAARTALAGIRKSARFAGYSAAGALLMGTDSAEATLVLTPLGLTVSNPTPGPQQFTAIDIDGVGPADDLIFAVVNAGALQVVSVANAGSQFGVSGTQQPAIGTLFYRYASRLGSGVAVSGGATQFPLGLRATIAATDPIGFPNANWVGGDHGFLPFRKEVGGDTFFGFVELQLSADLTELTIIGHGFETDANTPAITGSTAGPVVPEPSPLALLAMGAAGLIAWRRRRNASAEDAASD